jgi:hypothetical protein
LARRLGITRSQLYARALELFLRQQPHGDVTKRLDAVHGAAGRDALDQLWLHAGPEALRRVEWVDY